MSVNENRRERERRGTRRIVAALIALGLATGALVLHAPVASASSPFPPLTPDVAVLPFGGDVFTPAANGVLVPVDVRSTGASAPLFNAAGNPLNLTWGQFSSATAHSVATTVTRHGVDYTVVGIEMTGLVPNGVYSLFYRTFSPDSNNAVCPDVEPTVALTAAFPQFQKPDPDSFIAGSSGNAYFLASVAGRLLDAAQFQIVAIYHFDGHVYGPVANNGEANNNCRPSYGLDAIRQLVIIQK